MDNYNQQEFSNYTVLDSQPATGTGAVAKKFMATVFLWMFVALGISTLFALLFAYVPSFSHILYTDVVMEDGRITGVEAGELNEK